jgi:hypothetical protein
MLLALSAWPAAAGGGMCGGFVGAECAANEWCSYSPDNVCGIADGTGICKPRPEVCIRIYMPVCGCDAKTYSNACVAHSNGVSVAYVGTCRGDAASTPQTTTTTTTLTTRADCAQVISCGTKNGVRKEYPTPCAAEEDGATNISPKVGPSCEATQ